jgi:hypothetical protein
MPDGDSFEVFANSRCTPVPALHNDRTADERRAGGGPGGR